MKPIAYIIAGLVLALITIIALTIIIEDTPDFSPYNTLWNGLSKIRELYKAKTISLGDVRELAGGTLVIAGSMKSFSEDDLDVLGMFLERGGTLIILEDYGTQGYALARSLGLSIEQYMGVLVDPIFYYRDYRLPRVTFWYNITAYFNYGTAIKGDGVCIAYSSPFSYVDLNLNNVKDPGELVGPLCVAIETRIGSGTLIFIGDSSIALNAMVNVNSELLDKLFNRSPVYILSDRWELSSYSMFRSKLASIYSMLLDTQLRYVMLLSLILLFPLIPRTIRALAGESGADLGDTIKTLISGHPHWNEATLRRLLRDLYGDGGSKS